MGFGTTNEEEVEGDWETCTIQSRRRIVLSDKYMEFHGLDVGDDAIAVCKSDCIEVYPSDPDTLKKLSEDLE